MTRKARTEIARTLALAAIGFAVLMAVLPEWARGGALLFAALYAALVILVDDEMRGLLVRKARAKSPAARRAAT